MGFVKKAVKNVVKNVVGVLTGGLIGGFKPKPPPAVDKQTNIAGQESKTPEQINEERRRRLLALNAGGSGGQMTPPGGVQGQATISRKALLGL